MDDVVCQELSCGVDICWFWEVTIIHARIIILTKRKETPYRLEFLFLLIRFALEDLITGESDFVSFIFL